MKLEGGLLYSMSTTQEERTIIARLDRLPLAPLHYRFLGINGCAWAFDAFDVGLVTFVVTALVKAWELTPAQVGIILSSGMVGMIVGAFFSGPAG